MRKPFQGVWNIIRFNWHFYILSSAIIIIFLFLGSQMTGAFRIALFILPVLTAVSILISLIVSFYIYDISILYKLTWLDKLNFHGGKTANIHAGFDETSVLLKNKFEKSELLVFDFYNPETHTEVSIKRAREAYPPFSNTQRISTNFLPLQNNSVENIFAILSAHEIRNDEERISFFKELKRALTATGKIIVTEHLRDIPNFLAYNIGFFHFHSKATWLRTFQCAGLRVANEIKIPPLNTNFIL